MKTTITLQVICIIAFSLIPCRALHAQVETMKFARTASSATYELMEADSVGNIYVAGTFQGEYFKYGNDSVPGSTGTSTWNAFIMKTDPLGRLLWMHSATGGTDKSIIPETMRISQRGEMVVVLRTSYVNELLIGGIPVTCDNDNVIPVMAKFSKTGIMNWAYPFVCINDSTFPEVEIHDVFIEENGEVYATGSFRSDELTASYLTIPGLPDEDMMFIAKINNSNNLAWLKGTPYDSTQSPGNIKGRLIRNMNTDEFCVGGEYNGNRIFYFGLDSICNSNDQDVFVAKYSKLTGNATWGKVFRSDSMDYVTNLIVGPDHTIAVGILFNGYNLIVDEHDHFGFSGPLNLFFGTFSGNGEYLTSTTFDIRKPFYAEGSEKVFININPSGNYVLCSEFSSSSVLSGASILNNTETGTSDIFVTEIDYTTLEPLWSYQGAAAGDNYLEGVSIDGRGNTYLAGTLYSPVTFDPDIFPGNALSGAPYIIKLNPDGTRDYAFWQSNDVDGLVRIEKISADGYGNSIVTGLYTGNTSTIGDIGLTDPALNGTFIAKYVVSRNISGTVNDESGYAFHDGYVKIYGYTLYQKSPLNDSVILETNGSFHFTNIPAGEYIVVVYPLDESGEMFVPTYYPSQEYWEFAEKIRVTPGQAVPAINIVIQDRAVFSGNTNMTGNVSEADIIEDKFLNFDKGRPTKRAKVILAGNKKPQKSAYEVISQVETDDDGNFMFTGIEDGTYYLWVDIPGLPCEPVYLVEVDGSLLISNLDYLIYEEVVSAAGGEQYSPVRTLTDDERIRLYPVPASDQVNIYFPYGSSGLADIYDIQGRHIKSIEMNGVTMTVDVTMLKPGSYNVFFNTGNEVYFKRLVISR